MMKKLMSQQMLDLTIKAFKNKKRHNGEDYVNHPTRVGNKFKDERKRTLGFGHDTGEDFPKLWPKIKKEYPKDIYEGLRALARKENETYFAFIMRIRDTQDVDIIKVKIADLKDNIKDHDESSKKDKYRFALYILENEINKI
jgi:(p)ppGpp synthase/HD superfamily hydrolase